MWSPLRTILLEKHKKGNDETPSQPSVIPWTTCTFRYPFFLQKWVPFFAENAMKPRYKMPSKVAH